MFELTDFDSIQIGIANPDQIREWSHGEVTKAETINYRTLKPENNGLFCEKIFGPTKDWECRCGRYKRVRYKGVVCDKCGVEVTRKEVRRERMGHIELAAPVSHIWYFRGVPSRISIALDMSTKHLDQVIYFAKYIVIDPGDTPLLKKTLLTEEEYRQAQAQYGRRSFEAKMGAEAIKELLMEIDLDKEVAELKKEVAVIKGQNQRKNKLIKKLRLFDALRKSNARPEWMVLDVLPVLPPELRPLITLDGGRVASADLNELYRRVVIRNNTLKDMIDKNSPQIMINNAKRLLQESVDALIDNGRRGKAVTGSGGRELKSLTEKLKGKQGRFRQNLLGKRVDYSARSVIVVGPELKMHQCGLPKEIAVELFSPFIINKLIERKECKSGKVGKQIIERGDAVVWDILDEVIKDHPVLLNRAPTLHRLGIQAFEPVLVEGRAIQLHPLICSGFNADFDGDQMAVHLPLSIEAQAEARYLMLATNNIIKPSDGKPVVSPTQDMVLGIYHMTLMREKGPKEKTRSFVSADEAIMAYQLHQIALQEPIKVLFSRKTEDGNEVSKIIETTVGRILFNSFIPQDLGFVNRDTEESKLDLEINHPITKKELSQIVDAVFKTRGASDAAKILDSIKKNGFKYATKSGLTANVFDMVIPEEKKEIVKKADEKHLKIEENYLRGRLTQEQRYNEIINLWTVAKQEVDDQLFEKLGTFNPIRMMEKSGARGKKEQISQLCGMRGLVRDPSGKIVELPIKSSYREGLTQLEYFISSHGGRKGLADTALKTASSGYLTRRLVEIAHDVIVSEDDCGDTKGVEVAAIPGIENLAGRIKGRFTVEKIVNPKTKEVIVEKDQMISDAQADEIEKAGIKKVKIRSVLSCKCKNGCCTKCYGRDMGTLKDVKLGEAVGIIAAQSIGEPGTQLTMRNFHSGGVALGGDITQGLPRVEELFEARKPSGEGIISELAGQVHYDDDKREISIVGKDKTKIYPVGYTQKPLVKTGDIVETGTFLTSGSINLKSLMQLKGPRAVQEYIIQEVQRVYKSAGVEINDKHLEIIIKQMLKKVRVSDQGDTDMLPGDLVDITTFEEENEKAIAEEKRPAQAKKVLLGITKAALNTESFLSAASFQETARVLTEAAIQNKIDPLVGLKENIILGKQIPVGTGMKRYKEVKVVTSEDKKVVIKESSRHVDQAYLADELATE